MGQLERQDKGYEDEASKDIYSRESFESVDIRQNHVHLNFFYTAKFFFCQNLCSLGYHTLSCKTVPVL